MALAMANKVMTHSPSSELTPTLPEIVGMETLAMVISTTAMKDARPMVTAARASLAPCNTSIGRVTRGA